MTYHAYPGIPINPTKADGLPVHLQNLPYVSAMAGDRTPRDWRPSSAPPAREAPTRPRFVNEGV